ncbi:unnamed protein product [Adineta steineri]|uniref:Reverse transcriptase domain-containing protein n=2 Tax=Adineta steineri TaxID=433720 RepID=A0A815IR10_9BILA|nr:unnamed protein product [Adineta steineri]
MKTNKATGPDGISIEMIQCLDELGVDVMTKLINKIYDTGEIPEDLTKSIFIALPKKPGATECELHRTISLMSHITKVLLKILMMRMKNKMTPEIAKEQYGFMPDKGTRNAIFILRMIIERSIEVKHDIYLCFLDYTKVFDKVKHDSLFQILEKLDIDGKDLRLIRNLYWEQKAAMKVNNDTSEYTNIKRGVRQGCVLSPDLFNIYSEMILRNLEDVQGLNIGGYNCNNIRYADDTVLIASNEEDLQKMIDIVSSEKLSFDLIEQRLKELVARERKYLSQRNNDQLIKFKDDIHRAELFRQISTNLPTTNGQEDYIGQLITIREKQAEIWKEQLMLEIRIHCKFLPQNLDHLQKFMAPISYLPLNNNQKSIEVKNKHYKIIQEGNRTWLNYLLNTYEIKITEYELQYQNEYVKLESYVSTNMTTTSISVLNQVQEYINYRISKLKNDIYNKMSSFRKIILQNRQRSSSTKDTTGVWPEPYLDLISNPFDTRQWNYLSLGPSYIRLNQSAIRPQVQQQAVIKDEHEDICKKVKNNLINKPHCIPRSNPIFTEYSNHLLNYLNQCYSSPLPYKVQLQTLEQAQILGSIRKIIKNMGLIIRVTDKGHNFYIGSSIEFEKKAQIFFSDTNALEVLSNNPFNEIFDKVKQLLDKLCSKKLIMKWQYEEMMPDRTKCELAHLYFNPKTHKDGIPVRPIENTIPASTTKISKFLDKILRPLFQDKCKDTTIIDGAHLITELNKYSNQGLLKSTTLFCTFDIHNLYTMLPQEESLAILVEFLNVHGYKKVKCIDPITIKELASIVLQENAFAYDKKIYKQTTGGAMGSSFTLTLANIFIWYWQKKLVDEQMKTDEFYGRYIDDVFMTWNKSEQELKDLLDQANQWHPNIKLDYKISHSLPFLDVLLTNDYGILTTSVYHKPAAEPYVVPFTSDHPRHVFTNIIQTSLARAVRYSSTFKAFHYERRYIKLMLLYNGYPSTFIENEFNKCFFENQSTSPFLPFIYDEHQFFSKRQKLLGIPTTRQSQTITSAATANINNDQTHEDITPVTLPTANPKTITTTYSNKLFIHYTHEKRFQSCKKDMHRLFIIPNLPDDDPLSKDRNDRRK